MGVRGWPHASAIEESTRAPAGTRRFADRVSRTAPRQTTSRDAMRRCSPQVRRRGLRTGQGARTQPSQPYDQGHLGRRACQGACVRQLHRRPEEQFEQNQLVSLESRHVDQEARSGRPVRRDSCSCGTVIVDRSGARSATPRILACRASSGRIRSAFAAALPAVFRLSDVSKSPICAVSIVGRNRTAAPGPLPYCQGAYAPRSRVHPRARIAGPDVRGRAVMRGSTQQEAGFGCE